MKKVFIIFCLLVFTLPCFATFGYYEGCNDNVKPYDDSEYQAYAQKLKEEYYSKINKGELQCSNATYVEHVEYPLFKYIEEHPINYNK